MRRAIRRLHDTSSVADVLGVKGRWRNAGASLPGTVNVAQDVATWRVDIPAQHGLPSWMKVDSPYFQLGGSLARIELSVEENGRVHTGDNGIQTCRVHVWGENNNTYESRICHNEDHIIVEVAQAKNAEGETAVTKPPVSAAHTLTVLGELAAKWTIGLGSNPFATMNEALISPPYRLHHVLLGDMWFELHPNTPHPRYASIFFRIGQPELVMQVRVRVGPFDKILTVSGGSDIDEARRTEQFLATNLEAPNVWSDLNNGELEITAELVNIAALPKGLGNQ